MKSQDECEMWPQKTAWPLFVKGRASRRNKVNSDSEKASLSMKSRDECKMWPQKTAWPLFVKGRASRRNKVTVPHNPRNIPSKVMLWPPPLGLIPRRATSRPSSKPILSKKASTNFSSPTILLCLFHLVQKRNLIPTGWKLAYHPPISIDPAWSRHHFRTRPSRWSSEMQTQFPCSACCWYTPHWPCLSWTRGGKTSTLSLDRRRKIPDRGRTKVREVHVEYLRREALLRSASVSRLCRGDGEELADTIFNFVRPSQDNGRDKKGRNPLVIPKYVGRTPPSVTDTPL